MAVYQHSFAPSVAVGGQSIGGGAKTYQGSGQSRVSEAIANGGTNILVNFTLDVSQLKSIVIYSDKAITLKTNSSGSPTDTIAVKAGIPYVWNTDSYDVCLITADVTALYITNASGATANVQIDAVHDATP